MAWHGSLFGARYTPSFVFSYDLAGLEKAGDLATAKRFLSQFPDGALSSNSGCPFSPIVVVFVSVLYEQALCM